MREGSYKGRGGGLITGIMSRELLTRGSRKLKERDLAGKECSTNRTFHYSSITKNMGTALLLCLGGCIAFFS